MKKLWLILFSLIFITSLIFLPIYWDMLFTIFAVAAIILITRYWKVAFVILVPAIGAMLCGIVFGTVVTLVLHQSFDFDSRLFIFSSIGGGIFFLAVIIDVENGRPYLRMLKRLEIFFGKNALR